MDKTRGKIILKQMKVPGTAGQCLMLPPQSEKKPYVLYNLGGGLMNILVGLFCALFIPFSFHVVLTTFLFSMFAVGMFVGISNLVPMIIGGVATDGHNLMSVWKNPLLVDSLYKQLRATDDFIHGKSPLDYTDEYCTIPQGTDENEPLNTFILELKAERYLELNQFEKAKEIYLKLYENEKTMGVYRFTAQINLLILELFGERNEGMINKYYNDEMKKRVKANYTNISLILVELAIAKYIDHDEVAFAQSVQSLRQAYEKAPFPYEVEIAKKLLNQILSQE